MTRDASGFGRRAVLRAGIGAVLAVPLAGLAACTTEEKPKTPDPLLPLAVRARQDAADANAIAGAVPGLAGPAAEIAKGRTAHALALQAEIDRLDPPTSSAPPVAPPTPAAAPKSKTAATKKLRDALTKGQQQSAALIASVPRNRAGLLGSVSAGCAGMREVIS